MLKLGFAKRSGPNQGHAAISIDDHKAIAQQAQLDPQLIDHFPALPGLAQQFALTRITKASASLCGLIADPAR